jgi:predicted metal-dependent HD superfamily phosphohydrolase
MNEARWFELMVKLGIKKGADVYAALVSAYSEKHRYYHTGAHIDACLSHLDQVNQFAHHSVEVELALWFHDAIYKPRSSTNERDSANWCRDFLIANQVDQQVVERIGKLIMATCHNSPPSTKDELLVVDIDLTILGAREDIYKQFETDVRHEYRWVPGFIFRSKRKEILQSFLIRKRIYQHDYFYEKLEIQARNNLQEAIAQL